VESGGAELQETQANNQRRPNSTRSNGSRTLTETQAGSIEWAAPDGALVGLLAAAETRAAALRASVTALERAAGVTAAAPSFRAALQGAAVGVVAELKRRSPSSGVINERLDAATRAAEYAAGGAVALSVLTEPAHFGGSIADLSAARRATALPVVRKDFIVDRAQLLEARAAGASAVLLIARALPALRFAALAREAAELGLELLLEVRSEAELERALRVEGAVIGINSRDLETLAVDDAACERLLPRVPGDRLAVYESGIRDRAGVERAAALGADAVLVGSFLSAARDGEGAVAALVGVPRHTRGR